LTILNLTSNKKAHSGKSTQIINLNLSQLKFNLMTNLGKKADRLNLLTAYFKSHTEKGYTQETYKDLNIFTNSFQAPEGIRYNLIIYAGTSTNPICRYYYTKEEQRATKIQGYKNNADRRAQIKEESKGKRTLTGAAICAVAIREELKKLFPAYKFSVTSDTYSMGNSVHISWTDGPTVKQVEEITNKYQYGHFDGMTDMYENTNSRDDIPQAKYVSCNRTISAELKAILTPDLTEFLKSHTLDNYRDDLNSIMHRILYRTEIKDINNVKGIEEYNDSQLCGTDGYYKVSFINEEKETVKAEVKPNIKPIESNTGEVNIIEYSGKAIAVIGDTKPIKELLKSLGGSFNPRLTCGAGWIFSKKKLEEVQTALINNAKKEEPQTTQEENTNLPVIYTKPQTTLKDEIKQTVLFFAEQDIKNTGEVSQQTKEIAKIQDVEIIKETPTGKALNLEYFKILWHEGHQTPNFNDAVFTDWQEVQNAFFQLWERNEKGQNGGYTKVKCEIKFKNEEVLTDRIDITNRSNNGDFNPSEIHILQYLKETILEEGEEIEQDWRRHPELEHRHPLNVCDPQSGQYKEALMEYNVEHPKQYNNLKDIKEAANSGKLISLFNLSQIINNKTINV